MSTLPSLNKTSQSLIQPLSCRCSGICYPRDLKDCLRYFREFFDQPKGAAWPNQEPKIARDFLAVLTPHIDFRVSTIAYSHAYAPLLEASVADVYVVLGVGHHAHQEWSID